MEGYDGKCHLPNRYIVVNGGVGCLLSCLDSMTSKERSR